MHITGIGLSKAITADMRAHLPAVAEHLVGAIIVEVPSYSHALTGPMGGVIQSAVEVSLGTFLDLVSDARGADRTQAMDGAYALGRGEARSGRTVAALLSAYRVGARVAWSEMWAIAVRGGLTADGTAQFAEAVFEYIDELSAASVAGHTDELATTGQVRQRYLERLCDKLLSRAAADVLLDAAERADWTPPTTLTAMLLDRADVRRVQPRLDGRTLQPRDDAPGTEGLEDLALLLVPDVGDRGRRALLKTLSGTDATVGPARPWMDAAGSAQRAIRARALQLDQNSGVVDTEQHLSRLILSADVDAVADLRERVLAPLAELRPAAREKLVETLRSWLLHHGRREDMASHLFVHPQTVRYRMGQLRELYGERLDDPETVLDLTIALG